MKKIIALLTLLLSSSVFANQPGQCGPGFDLWDLNCDGKINYEEGIASQQAYRDDVARVHQPVAREGLPTPKEAGYPEKAYSEDNRTWKNVLSSRVNNRTYRNTTSKPIIVAVTPVGERWEEMLTYVNGRLFGRVYSGDFGGGSTITMEVPVGSTYRVRVWNQRGQVYGITNWLEFREN